MLSQNITLKCRLLVAFQTLTLLLILPSLGWTSTDDESLLIHNISAIETLYQTTHNIDAEELDELISPPSNTFNYFSYTTLNICHTALYSPTRSFSYLARAPPII